MGFEALGALRFLEISLVKVEESTANPGLSAHKFKATNFI